LKWTEGLGLIEDGTEVSEDTGWKDQRAATAGLGIVTVLAGYQEILKEKKRFLSGQTSLLNFFRPSLGTRASLPILLDHGDDDKDDLPTVTP
jgi:hypothetical protein